MTPIKSIIVVLGLLVAACSCSPNIGSVRQERRQTQAEILDAMRSTVALVKERDPISLLLDPSLEPYKIYCSAFYIRPRLLVTAAHCITDDDGMISVGEPLFVRYGEWSDGGKLLTDEPHRATVKNISVNKDIAVLEVKDVGGRSRNHFRLRRHLSLKAGDRLFVIGHPLGLSWTYTQGYLTRLWNKDNWLKPGVRIVQTQAVAYFGNSGGILFNRNNEVVGICSFLAGGQSTITFFISYQELHKLL